MTGNKVLLDTNIIVALLNGESGIADKIDNAANVFLPIITIGELYYGVSNSQHVEKNAKEIKKLTKNYPVKTADENAALLYGQIKASLRKKGTPIPENDIWIAAIALRYKLTLITRDKHFNQIADLKVKRW